MRLVNIFSNLGTGKTRLIISIILQLLFGQEMKQKLRILVLASSNAAVDIIAKRLLHIRDKMESGKWNERVLSHYAYILREIFNDIDLCVNEAIYREI